MATVTVANVDRAGGVTHISPVSASAAPPPVAWPVVLWSMGAVAAAIVIMWFVNAEWIKPSVIQIKTGYVPFAGLVVVTAGLERLLEPLSNVLMPKDASKQSPPEKAATSKSAAQRAAASPDISAAEVQSMVETAAADQAAADKTRSVRTITFWAIASVSGLGISGGFGFFLLQSVASNHVNTLLDLAVTGLAIGGGTKPVHDLITSIQSKAAA